MKKLLLFILFLSTFQVETNAQSILLEAESFTDKGGWLVDPQFVEQMGSPYLLAHCMGVTVKDAVTDITIEKTSLYQVWVRTRNWVPGKWEAHGRFSQLIDEKKLERTLGLNPEWNWEYAGKVQLTKGTKKLTLGDLTGFEGRCDAIYFVSLRKYATIYKPTTYC